MNLTEWKAKHAVNTFTDYTPENDGYWWIAHPFVNSDRSLRGQGTTEFAACYALARKLQVEPPVETSQPAKPC